MLLMVTLVPALVGWVEPLRNPSCLPQNSMGFAEPVIGRAFARPVGSTHPTIAPRGSLMPPDHVRMPESLWAAVTPPGPELPRLEGHAEADVVIIGAGF